MLSTSTLALHLAVIAFILITQVKGTPPAYSYGVYEGQCIPAETQPSSYSYGYAEDINHWPTASPCHKKYCCSDYQAYLPVKNKNSRTKCTYDNCRCKYCRTANKYNGSNWGSNVYCSPVRSYRPCQDGWTVAKYLDCCPSGYNEYPSAFYSSVDPVLPEQQSKCGCKKRICRNCPNYYCTDEDYDKQNNNIVYNHSGMCNAKMPPSNRACSLGGVNGIYGSYAPLNCKKCLISGSNYKYPTTYCNCEFPQSNCLNGIQCLPASAYSNNCISNLPNCLCFFPEEYVQ